MAPALPKRRVVLLVEDDADLRRLFKSALIFEGFAVDDVGDALDALRHIDERRPDIVLLDLGLPGLSGLAVQQEIAGRAFTRHIPVVVVTGSTEALDHLDVSCVLRKPVTPERLIATVRKCLSSGARGAGA